MIGYVIVGVICLAIGFIGGMLVFRKNKEKFENIEKVARG